MILTREIRLNSHRYASYFQSSFLMPGGMDVISWSLLLLAPASDHACYTILGPNTNHGRPVPSQLHVLSQK